MNTYTPGALRPRVLLATLFLFFPMRAECDEAAPKVETPQYASGVLARVAELGKGSEEKAVQAAGSAGQLEAKEDGSVGDRGVAGGAPAMTVPVALTEEMAELARLEGLAPASIPVQEAGLSAAINLVASAAGMNFIAPAPEEFPEAVTLSTRVSPWRLLGLLAERYRFTMHFRGGVWVFDREASGALVSKTYLLKYTNLDSYKSSQNSFNQLGAQAQGSEAQAAGGLVFTAQTQKIMEDLRELVGLAPSQLAKDGHMPEQDNRRPVKGEGAERGSEQKTAGSQGKVLYLPDANALYVTATRRQHEHIGEYLRIVDKPVRQIRIEARFFETTHDPKFVLGMDPSGYQPNVTLSNITTQMDLGRVRGTPWPDKVLLSADTLRFQIQALQTDERSKLVNNPTVVVANNREAYFSVGDEEPFVSANSISNGAADGGFGTTQAQVTIRRIGTTINLVPTLFEGAPGEVPRIRLSVRIEVGVLKGFRQLNSVAVPVVSSQKYEYTVFLRAGETLAFGGLSGSTESEAVKKVPLAGDIPLLGHAFRSRSKQSTQRNLVAYLSASLAGEGEAAPSLLVPAGVAVVQKGSLEAAQVAGGGR